MSCTYVSRSKNYPGFWLFSLKENNIYTNEDFTKLTVE